MSNPLKTERCRPHGLYMCSHCVTPIDISPEAVERLSKRLKQSHGYPPGQLPNLVLQSEVDALIHALRLQLTASEKRVADMREQLEQWTEQAKYNASYSGQETHKSLTDLLEKLK